MLDPRISASGIESIAQYHQRTLSYLQNEIIEALRGNKHGAFKAALNVLRDIRNEVHQAVQEGTITDWSFGEELGSFYTPFNSFVSIGPPLYRIEQLAAAIRTGTITLLPPDPFISPNPGTGTATVTGRCFPPEPISVDAVVEARQPKIDALGTSHELRTHIRGARRNGCTFEEIIEATLHASACSGMPDTIEGAKVAQAIAQEETQETEPGNGIANN